MAEHSLDPNTATASKSLQSSAESRVKKTWRTPLLTEVDYKETQFDYLGGDDGGGWGS